ncbi:MAG UNVERIFIED_CONTAM: hypothetical protein LVT10_05800 [Anaerolineae bacterium]|jgi:asparagine synthase (glutamine-hydrolysing)
MCGICGTLNIDQPSQQHTLEAMCAAMLHRGPDEDGFFVQGTIGLGMRRLKIIDLATGKQPITNEVEACRWFTTGNLQLPHVAPALLPHHTFHTQSDTETIVHGYEQWGVAVVERLNGMFAFALWDGHQQRALLARDPSGQKPLYYYHAPDGSLNLRLRDQSAVGIGACSAPVEPARALSLLVAPST